jgi:hypothetical protein
VDNFEYILPASWGSMLKKDHQYVIKGYITRVGKRPFIQPVEVTVCL